MRAPCRLRRILSADLPPSVRFEDARAEPRRLEGMLVDAVLTVRRDGGRGRPTRRVQAAKDLEDKSATTRRTRRETAESQLEEYEQADEDSVEHVLASLLKERCCTTTRSRRCRRRSTTPSTREDRSDAAKRTTRLERATRCRPAWPSWLVDRTAAESSDHFRAKYEGACRERADYANAVRDALCDQRQSAGRSKVKREVLDSLEQAIRARSAKP